MPHARGVGHLQRLAWEVGAPERTLRRAVSTGMLRCRRPTPRRLEIDVEERAYLRSHWELLSRLREVLRTEPNVRFAAIFGSVARGDESEASDIIDLVIDFARRDRRGRIRLANNVEAVSGRRAQLLHLRDVELCAPDLLGEVLVEGRVLVDRNDHWPELMRRRRQILERARDARQELLASERAATSRFEREAASA